MINIKDIKKLAKLAKISMSENELKQLTQDMIKIISFVDTINESYNNEKDFEDIREMSNVFRDDVVKESFDRDLILSGVNDSENGFFSLKN